jgi:uncharacterized protein
MDSPSPSGIFSHPSLCPPLCPQNSPRSAELNASTSSIHASAESICLACGLCCNGVIFADVKLQPKDDCARLQALGLPLLKPRKANAPARTQRWRQPCAALDGCRCRIYSERPKYCREFECLLLRSVQAGQTAPAAALRIIRTARQRAEKVRRLLQTLGDTDELTALAVRFRRISRRMQQIDMDEAAADTYARLTLAVHDLNLVLSSAFYPGSRSD